MGNTNGSAYCLTVLTPVVPGHEQALTTRLAAIPGSADGSGSPFTRASTTHFARLVLIPQLVDQGPPQRPVVLRGQYLLYSSVFTAALADHLEDLRTALQPTTDEIWGHCVGYPGAADAVRFAAWFRHNQIDASLFFAGNPDADPGEIRAALALRKRLVGFVVDGQNLSDTALLARFQDEFRPVGARA